MRLLLVVAYFIPEIGSAAHVYLDLAKAFIKIGHGVHILTSYPREFNVNQRDKGKTFPLDEIIEGIHVHRCKHPAQRDNIVLRGLEHFILPRYYFKKYKQINLHFDACLMYIPPLPLYYLARKIKRYDKTPSVLNFQDFHPQELVDVGVMKNPIWIKILEHIEKKAYKNADFITVLSKKGVDYIIKRGGNPNKIKHIYNSVSLDDFDKKKIKKDFKEKQKIQDKILVTYAGILSPYQGLDTILDTAKQIKKNDDFVFYIIGEGPEKNNLKNRIKNEDISNIKIMPFQKRDEYFNIINSSDISLVSLDNRMKAPCLPGKIKDLLALQKPIVASVSSDTETADFIKEANAGLITDPGDNENLKNNILSLQLDKKLKKDIEKKSILFLEENMNLDLNVKKYEGIFKILIKN